MWWQNGHIKGTYAGERGWDVGLKNSIKTVGNWFL